MNFLLDNFFSNSKYNISNNEDDGGGGGCCDSESD